MFHLFFLYHLLISLENISGIDFLFYIIQALVIAVRNDGLTLLLELIQVINNLAAKESVAFFQGRLINNDSCALSLDALHNTLNGTLTEVVAVTLHSQTINAYNNFFLLALIPAVICFISTSNLQNTVSDEIFSCSGVFPHEYRHCHSL